MRFNSIFHGLALASVVAVGSMVGLAPKAQATDFWNPMIGNYRLDWCREWATNCGQPAADAFCQARGYARATGFVPANDIGAQTPTRVINTGEICNQAFCDGFRRITCQANTSNVFNYPMIGNYRLDWCREWGTNCGWPAAHAFCQAMGFSQASGFVPANDIGAQTPTRVITSGQICNQAFCDGFRGITCR